jgi:hypothetical protein
LFIFDGLDEVPGDIKDDVASAVIAFVDQVLVGCRADALCVCTSRPQGYSGQFTPLEATLLELPFLSPDQALACAKPVLEIDRSKEQSARYFQILREAIKSPAIREIMTTPLQSHIMAVVVRDGGKPPDKKWELFSNFYEVIRKREANRQLVDDKLAMLLQERQKLLKNLHDQLGFELHYRVETSDGAQTSLDRKELRKIIQNVVTELQDDDVEETIRILMEATTERLVLVSTPDIGRAVRFDIRPLQEFFAGEYIASADNSEHLGDRLRVFAGDPHWREVTHFVLSSIVEKDRKPELAVAVGILTELNEGADGEETRMLRRRLALGGVIAARLLQEGVLEQDKRIRQQFRRCIEPLLACTDAGMVIRNVSQPHSRSWLSDLLIDTILEQSEAESIGAAGLLPTVVSDGHPRLPSVEQFLQRMSRPQRSCFLTLVADDLRYSRFVPDMLADAQELPTWTLRYACRVLMSNDWYVTPADIRRASRILTFARSRFEEVAVKEGVHFSLVGIFRELVCGDGDIGEGLPDKGSRENIGGVIRIARQARARSWIGGYGVMRYGIILQSRPEFYNWATRSLIFFGLGPRMVHRLRALSVGTKRCCGRYRLRYRNTSTDLSANRRAEGRGWLSF